MPERLKDGGPAFPQTHESGGGAGETHPVPEGMSLRDWFAGMVLIGRMAIDEDFAHTARICYTQADVMLERREASL